MIFNKESDFEEALIKILSEKGWEKEVLKNYSEQDLLQNWANILFENNRDIDRLNDYPLTDGEMQQILEQIKNLRTPLKLNGFINGKSVSVIRDNPDDKLHFGKEVSLKIYVRVFVSFVVNQKGEVTNVKVARPFDPNLDKEAVRVVQSMPKWSPGKQRGKAVKVSYTVPINFVLQ